MLQTQVDYWKYIETMRHNKQLEQIEQAQASAAMRTAEANYQNALTNQKKAEIDYLNALTNQANAESNRMQAQAAMAQAEASRVSAQAAVTQASAAKQQAAAAHKNATVNEYLSYSQSALNRANASNAYSSASYNAQKTQTEVHNTSIAATDARFRHATNVSGLVMSYAQSYHNITSGTGTLLRGVSSVKSAWTKR